MYVFDSHVYNSVLLTREGKRKMENGMGRKFVKSDCKIKDTSAAWTSQTSIIDPFHSVVIGYNSPLLHGPRWKITPQIQWFRAFRLCIGAFRPKEVEKNIPEFSKHVVETRKQSKNSVLLSIVLVVYEKAEHRHHDNKRRRFFSERNEQQRAKDQDQCILGPCSHIFPVPT